MSRSYDMLVLERERLVATAVRKAPQPTRQSGAMHPYSLGLSGWGDVRGVSQDATIELHEQQMSHYLGRAYSAIRPIRTRVAAQPMFVARRRAPKKGEQSIKSWLQTIPRERRVKFRMPEHLKETHDLDELTIIERHLFLETLRRPNAIMTKTVLWDMTVGCLQVCGLVYWLLDQKKDGTPAIIPLPPTWVKPLHENGEMFSSYEIKPPHSISDPIPVDASKMARFYFPHITDPFDVLSPLQAAMRSVLADEAVDVAHDQSFRNGANPSLALIVDPEATDGEALTSNQRAELISWVKREYAGVLKHGLPMVLDALVKDVKMISHAPKELDFLRSGDALKRNVYQTFGVSPIIAGEDQNANRAGSAEADHHFVDNVINPMLNLMSEVLTAYVAPYFSDGADDLEIWIAPAVPHDPELKLQQMQFLASIKAIRKNEAREYADLPPDDEMEGIVGEGEETDPEADPLQLGQEQDDDKLPKDQEDTDEEDDDEEEDEDKKKGRRRVLAARKNTEPRWHKAQDRHERNMARQVKGLLDRQRKTALEGAVAMLRGEGPMQAFEASDWDKELIDTVSPVVLAAMLMGGELESAVLSTGATGTARLGIPESAERAIQREHAAIMALLYWLSINQTTQHIVEESLSASIRDGDTPDVTINKLAEKLAPERTQARADGIAAGEATAAMNAGAFEVIKDVMAVGGVATKTWLTMRDEKVRDSHAVLDGTSELAGGVFLVGGHPAPYPGHHSLPVEQRINCRCRLTSGGVVVFDPSYWTQGQHGGTALPPFERI